MSKKVTGRAPPAGDVVDAGLPPPQALEFVGVKLTPYQARMKSKFWSLVRDDPMVDPACMSGMEIATLLGEPRVATWLRDPAVLQVFLNGNQWLQNLEWLHDLWTERALEIVLNPFSETKDLIALGRELAKMTGRSGPADALAAGAGAPKAYTPEQARKAIETAARQMGWQPPAPATPAPEAPSEELPQ